MPLTDKPILSLKQFLLKQEVKNLYRRILKTIRQVPDESNRNELKAWARSDFRSNAHHTDEVTIKMLIKSGERSLKELENNLCLTR
ncbi:hypothetical protein RN001_005083 [Aquatica leii]|uniref:LYR motif-containing protein 2 n=1 Tax=Aquatica leii TaxID=1421715 RepID=A0AAN7PZL2_9COLE|nr:hypothetical protein RN001_005083 [Aquatica leii]